MEPVKISMRGLAEVSSAAPSRKRSTLKRYLSPRSGESVGRSNYYVKALSLIKRHHKGDSAFVTSHLSKLLAEANAEINPRRKTKLLSNYRAITEYLTHFGRRKLMLTSGKHLYYIFDNLIVSAQPDLVAEEDGSLVLIKLNLSKKDFPGGVCAILLQLLYEAAQTKGLSLSSSSVECLQTNSGSRIIGPKSGFPSRQTLNAACKELLVLRSQL